MKKLLKPFINTPWYDKILASVLYLIILCFIIAFLFGASVLIYKYCREILLFLGTVGFFISAAYILAKYYDF